MNWYCFNYDKLHVDAAIGKSVSSRLSSDGCGIRIWGEEMNIKRMK